MSKIDYEKALEQTFEALKQRVDVEKEYFDLLRQIKDGDECYQLVNEHFYDIKMEDQILLLRCLVQTRECNKWLCDKYGLCDEGKGDEDV
jgi:hypothetical protein